MGLLSGKTSATNSLDAFGPRNRDEMTHQGGARPLPWYSSMTVKASSATPARTST